MNAENNILFTCQELAEKERRNLLIADLIRTKGVISRTEISRITGMNAVSVSNYVNNYIRKRIVLEKGFDVSSGGRKPELIEFNSKGIYVVGVEAGARGIRGVLADLAMNVAAKARISTEDGIGLDLQIVRLVEELLEKARINKDAVKAIGIGIPDNGYVHLAGEVQKRLGVDAFVGGYAFCSAFGEKRLNPEADAENILYIYSDRGRGIAIKGFVFFGAAGKFGELDTPDLKEEKVAGEELKYLQPWGEGFSIVRAAKERVAKGIGTKIVDIAKADISGIAEETVIEAALQKDQTASDIINIVGINLGLRIAYLINLFNPQIVVVGGGVERAGELILSPIKKMINKFASIKQPGASKIKASILGEDAVMLGASSLAAREIFLKA